MKAKNSLLLGAVVLLGCFGLVSAAYFDGNTVFGGNNSGDSLIVASNPFGNAGVFVGGEALSPVKDATVTEATDLGGLHKSFGNLYLAGQLRLRSQGFSSAFTNFITSPYQTSNVNYVLPIVQGGFNTVLTNNGNGVLSWKSFPSSVSVASLEARVTVLEARLNAKCG
jgi:hypothetical protein